MSDSPPNEKEQMQWLIDRIATLEAENAQGPWRMIRNGISLKVGEAFFWLNAYGVGIGLLDHEGLGRRQLVHYWRKTT